MVYLRLLRKIEESGGIEKISDATGIGEELLAKKLCGAIPFYADEAEEIMKCLSVTCGEEKIKFFYPHHPENGMK